MVLSWQVAEIYHICQRNGWVKPTVYQGMYNAITRDVEKELFPCLRNYDMRFYAYNILAGGMLTGRYTALESEAPAGRFARPEFVKLYLPRYYKQAYIEALQPIRDACEKEGLSMAQAAISWLICNSSMDANYRDGIILGASSVAQLKDTMALVRNAKPLPESVLEAMDMGWTITKPHCTSYYR